MLSGDNYFLVGGSWSAKHLHTSRNMSTPNINTFDEHSKYTNVNWTNGWRLGESDGTSSWLSNRAPVRLNRAPMKSFRAPVRLKRAL